MAQVTAAAEFALGIKFRSITWDELAHLTRTAVKYGLLAPPSEARAVQHQIRAMLPVLAPAQLAIVFNAFVQPIPKSWVGLADEIERLAQN